MNHRNANEIHFISCEVLRNSVVFNAYKSLPIEISLIEHTKQDHHNS